MVILLNDFNDGNNNSTSSCLQGIFHALESSFVLYVAPSNYFRFSFLSTATSSSGASPLHPPSSPSPCASMLAAAVEDTVSASARLTAAVTAVDPEERRKIEMDRMIERHRKKELIQGRNRGPEPA